MQDVVAVDIGGTNARFAIAKVDKGRVVALGEATTLRTAEHASLALAWEAYRRKLDQKIPNYAGIAIAAPIQGDVVKMTNNPWVIHPSKLTERLHLEQCTLVNDFGAVAHAVAQVEEKYFQHLCGPERPLAKEGPITVVGPGTGLGTACLLRRANDYTVLESEGGHINFAPLNAFEDKVLAALRRRFRRVSAERIVSGPGLTNLYEVITEMHGHPMAMRDNKALWDLALQGKDELAVAALDYFFLSLGAVAGDLALVHKARSVVIAGGLGSRLAERFAGSGFSERFVAKGRFEVMMSEIPVKIIVHPQPGLFGAAAAFAVENPDL